MTSKQTDLSIDIREVTKEHFTFRVQYKNMLWLKIGLVFIRIGCWLTGASFVDEFPMSLYQDDKDVK